jgi:hypothetical protein
MENTKKRGIAVWLMTGILILVIVTLTFIVFPIVGKNTTIAIENDQLQIKSPLYGTTLPLNKIIVDEIVKINLTEDTDYRIVQRTNGMSVPGFISGWVTLENGKKALVYISDETNVALIPTTEDYVILITMNDVDTFKEGLIRKI